MSRKKRLETTILEIVPPTVELPTELPTETAVLGPAHDASEFPVCVDVKGLCVTPVLSFDVLYDVVHTNGTADFFRGILNDRAYFTEQKYATRLRHANERASENHVDGTTPAVVTTRKAKHVDVTGAQLAIYLGMFADAVRQFGDAVLRVPREVSEVADYRARAVETWRADFLASAVTDAQDALRTFGRSVNREAGERTTPADVDVANTLRANLRNALDVCSADAAEVTVVDVTTVRAELAESWDAYKAATTVRKAALTDLNF